jgi:long-chain acyl-CoA synthetase
MPPTHSRFGPEIADLYQSFAQAAAKFPNGDCMGKRSKGADGTYGPFEFISYQTAHEQIKGIASGLASLSLQPKACYGMYGKNTIEWQQCALAGFARGMTCVPVYDTLGDNIVQYEANHSDMEVIIVEAAKLKGVANVIGACKTIKHVIQLEPLGEVDPSVTEALQKANVNLIDLKTLMARGAESPVEPVSSGGDGLAFIMYTSGTTGDPKGVCITNNSITVGATWCAGLTLLPTDRYLSFLPLAHIFETMVEHGIWSAGGAVGFFPGNIKQLQDDILTLKPTIFVGVPRVYQRFYDVALSKLSNLPGPLATFLKFALDKETAAVRVGSHSMYAGLLHKMLGAKLTGGNVRIMISGAAPLPVHVQEFLLAACGGSVIQGYGMTENCANATLAHSADYRAGHVGGPMPTVQVKLVDVAEMNYLSNGDPPSGEVIIKGPTVFSGYHKNKEETDKVLTKEGWLSTGDIGRWNKDGTLSIIDRKKNIFKLAQGEYVAAEKIEMAISKSKYISQPWVYGNSFFPMLVAVVVPDFIELKAAAKEGGWLLDSTSELAKKDEACALVLKEIEREAKAAGLKSFEVPKKVILEGEVNDLGQGFSIDNDCLTPTFKLKRPQLLKRYQEEVDGMYVALGENPAQYK